MDKAKIIKLEKEKIKKEKRAIRRAKLKKSRFYKIFGFLIKEEDETYSFKEVLTVSICSLLVGIFGCFVILTSSPINRPLLITTLSFPKDKITNWLPSFCGSST